MFAFEIGAKIKSETLNQNFRFLYFKLFYIYFLNSKNYKLISKLKWII